MTAPSILGRAALGLFAAAPFRLGRAPRGGAPKRLVVVSLGDNPSFSYYLAPRLGGIEHRVVSPWDDPEAALGGGDAGAYVLFCRYFSRAWAIALARRAGRLAGAGLFLDDDIEAVVADRQAPLGYRLRLVARHIRYRQALARELDRLWVSTPELARRFPDAAAIVLPPAPGEQDRPRPRPPRAAPGLAFHATGVHEPEHAWLAPIVAKLLGLRPNVTFEVVADGARARPWRGVAGVRVIAPLAWPRYREATAESGADLMLAPLVDNAANRSRAPTRRIDAYRAGAALLTTAPWVYRPSAAEAGLGMAAPREPEAFLAALVALVDSPERRQRLAALNAARVERMAAEAAPLFAP